MNNNVENEGKKFDENFESEFKHKKSLSLMSETSQISQNLYIQDSPTDIVKGLKNLNLNKNFSSFFNISKGKVENLTKNYNCIN